jgi:nitrite reductase/ring-hydroxylating ferredoxin subunit/uncharacterized membrane protein
MTLRAPRATGEDHMADTAIDLIDQQNWLNSAADALQPAVHQAFDALGESGRTVKDALHGVWLGHPVHPALTDVPIGAWTTALVFDTLEASGTRGFARAADAAIAVGLVGAVGAAITGLTDWSETDGRAKRVGLTHGLLNITAAGLYGASLWFRRRGRRRQGRGFAFAGYSAVMASAYLGGNLVYDQQIGVDRSAHASVPEGFTRVASLADVPENQPVRVMADRTPVLLVRRGTTIRAIAETCSHLSGPLAEGRLDGNTIQCPWHGSTFCIDDGSVVRGPATHPQPVYEARVRDGGIEIRQPADGAQ